ncbi:MAG TPA: arginine deiminase family protein [Longimicrobiales bacterium]
MIALTRDVPPSIVECELTHRSRCPIDVDRAIAQHESYQATLASLGCTILRLPAAPHLPDSVFVEDTAVVLPDIAIITRPGAESRRPETASMAEALSAYRPLAFVEAPGTLDGGDVLRIGSRLFVGRSLRSNTEGIRQLAALVAPHYFDIITVDLTGCLHLKSAVTQVGDDTLLINRAWVDASPFDGMALIDVEADESGAANALLVGETVVFPAAYPRTRLLLEEYGFDVRIVEADELEKAEAGVTCCSVLVTQA